MLGDGTDTGGLSVVGSASAPADRVRSATLSIETECRFPAPALRLTVGSVQWGVDPADKPAANSRDLLAMAAVEWTW